MVSKNFGKILLAIQVLVYFNSISVDCSRISTPDNPLLFEFSKSARTDIEAALNGNLNKMKIWWKVDWIYPLVQY